MYDQQNQKEKLLRSQRDIQGSRRQDIDITDWEENLAAVARVHEETTENLARVKEERKEVGRSHYCSHTSHYVTYMCKIWSCYYFSVAAHNDDACKAGSLSAELLSIDLRYRFRLAAIVIAAIEAACFHFNAA